MPQLNMLWMAWRATCGFVLWCQRHVVARPNFTIRHEPFTWTMCHVVRTDTTATLVSCWAASVMLRAIGWQTATFRTERVAVGMATRSPVDSRSSMLMRRRNWNHRLIYGRYDSADCAFLWEVNFMRKHIWCACLHACDSVSWIVGRFSTPQCVNYMAHIASRGCFLRYFKTINSLDKYDNVTCVCVCVVRMRQETCRLCHTMKQILPTVTFSWLVC